VAKETKKYVDKPRYRVIEKYEDDFKKSFSDLMKLAVKEIKIKLQ